MSPQLVGNDEMEDLWAISFFMRTVVVLCGSEERNNFMAFPPGLCLNGVCAGVWLSHSTLVGLGVPLRSRSPFSALIPFSLP